VRTAFPTATRQVRPFAPWRIVVWMVMLLAAGGFVVNGYASVVVAQSLAATSAEAAAGGPDGRIALAWAIGYALISFGTMVVALSTLRWATWARAAMRVIAILLLVWAGYTGFVLFGQWQQVGTVLGQPGLPADLVAMASHQHTIMLVVLLLKAVSIPLMAWLYWSLGSPAVRRQFSQLVL